MTESIEIKPLSAELKELGWTEFFEAQRQSLPMQLEPARVAIAHSKVYQLLTEQGPVMGTLSGRVRWQALSRLELPAVGDWVGIERQGEGQEVLIHHLFERFSCFVRKSPGRRVEIQVIAANINTVVVVTSFNSDFNVRRLERYLAAIEESGAQPLILINKLDLCPDPEPYHKQLQPILGTAAVLETSAKTGQGLEQLRNWAALGQTLALVGSSGVGKSTLVNCLLGEEALRTGPLRERDERGQHTTSHRQIHRLSQGGLLIDNPGMREFQIWASEEPLSGGFEDIQQLAETCHFRDCKHINEPGCQVLRALNEGQLSQERLASYRKLAGEQTAMLDQGVVAILEKKRRARSFGRMTKDVIRRKYGPQR